MCTGYADVFPVVASGNREYVCVQSIKRRTIRKVMGGGGGGGGGGGEGRGEFFFVTKLLV